MLRFISRGISVILLAITAGLLWLAYVFFTTPNVADINSCFVTEMHQVHLCPKGNQYVPLSAVSRHLKNAVIISEDAGFYGHSGFDIDEIKNSFDKNLKVGEFARGGSTISQQLAKNTFLSGEKTIARKLREAIVTIQIEDKLSKNQILEKYLNVVEFGPNIYGVKAAAKHYFSKMPADLTPLEAAFLAMLLPNPKKYSISFTKKKLTSFARKGVLRTLAKLHSVHRISGSEYAWSRANIDLFPWNGLVYVETPFEETPVEDTAVPQASESAEEEI